MSGNFTNRGYQKTSGFKNRIHSVCFKFSESRFKNCGLGIIAIVAIFGYLFSVNALAIKGFEIKELQKEITSLEKEHNDLKFEVAKLQSIDDLENSSENFGLIKISQAQYINSAPDAIALNK